MQLAILQGAADMMCPTPTNRTALCIGLTLILASTVASRASAQSPTQPANQDASDDEARQLFEAGSDAMTEGRYEDALRAFEQAYELSDRPRMLYNIALVSERLHLNENALSTYERYLRETPTPDRRPEVERRIEILERELAQQRALEEAVQAKQVATETEPPPKPKPQATAAASTATPPAQPEPAREDAPKRWWKNPWLWTAVGVVVVGAGVGAGVAAAGSKTKTQASVPTDWEETTPSGFRF